MVKINQLMANYMSIIYILRKRLTVITVLRLKLNFFFCMDDKIFIKKKRFNSELVIKINKYAKICSNRY